MYELYYMPTTASLSVHWVLVYLERTLHIPHKLHLVSFPDEQQKAPSYTSLNPLGRVPTLIIDGQALTESVAILLYLADAHPDAGLVPKDKRGYYETISFIAYNLLPALRDYIYAGRDCPPSDAPAVKRLAWGKMERAWDWLDRRLQGGWSCGDAPSVVDFLVVSLTAWTAFVREQAAKRRNVNRLMETMQQREDWVEVRKRETEVEEKL